MTDLGYVQALLLGVVQGLTEFLPISSSGHLALTQRWFQLGADSPEMLLFNVVAHAGTVLAVAIVFAQTFRRFASRFLEETTGSAGGRAYATHIVVLAVCATLPTALVGMTFKRTFESAFGKPVWIGIALIVTGFLLAGLMLMPRGRRGWKRFHWWQACLVGLAQSMAILPGISRSGTTICLAMFLGLRRRWAGEFSFLIAVPAIAGATLMKMADTLTLPTSQLTSIRWGPVLVGGAVSLIVGVFALRLLLEAVRRAKLHYFAIYCWALGGFVLLFVR